MVSRRLLFAPGERYHVFTRGVEKRDIFMNDNDRFRFQLLLYTCNSKKQMQLSVLMQNIAKERGISKRDFYSESSESKDVSKGADMGVRQGGTLSRVNLQRIFGLPRSEPLVDILAYSLMPNHFHLVLQEVEERGIEKFMQRVMTAYAMHFNKKYKRVGALFVRPFKAKHLSTEAYFQHIFWYVHLNPIDLVETETEWKERKLHDPERVREFMRIYPWSSYQEYMYARERRGGDRESNGSFSRPESAILNTEELPDYIRMADSVEDAIRQYQDTAYVEDPEYIRKYLSELQPEL